MFITAILPNFNHAAELETSLSAIVGQSQPFDEIIVIDDASTDHSLQVIERFARQTPQIRVLRNPQRMGVAATVDRGVESACDGYIVLTSADEKIMPDMCQVMAGEVARTPDLAMAISRYALWDPAASTVTEHGRESPLGMWYVPDETPMFISPSRFRALLKQQFVWLGANTAIIRRDALVEVGGFDPALRWHSDWFALYAIAARYGFAAVPRTLAWFRYSQSSYSARGMRDRRSQAEVVTNIARKLDDPKFAALKDIALAAPAVLAPFTSDFILALAKQPAYRRLWLRIVRWWLLETIRGRRRGMLLRMLRRLRSR